MNSLAVGVATITAGRNFDSYPLMLEADTPNLAQAQEFTVEDEEIVPTDSWWTALTGCVTRRCATVCANSVATCATGGGWIKFLGCMGWNCGGCVIRCGACATCNCRWWCKWATGCCRR